MTKDQILAALPNMDHAALREIKALAEFFLKGSTEELKRGGIEDSFELTILKQIVRSMIPHGGTSLARLKSSGGYPAFHDKMEGLKTFFARYDEATTQWLVKLSIQVMIEKKESWGHLITGVMIMAEIEKLPAFLDQAFPGYAKAGMLGMIRKHGRGVERDRS